MVKLGYSSFNVWEYGGFESRYILLVKTTPVLLLSNWICEGQGSLDNHFEWLCDQLV